MKKRIISILLVMVIVLTMTACVSGFNDTQTATFEPTEVTTETTSATTVDRHVEVGMDNYEPKVNRVETETLKTMNPEEVSDFFDEMVHISETELLSVPDMCQMGYNFYYIWRNYPTFDKSEFEAQAYKAFSNVYNQAVKSQIPLEEISIWADIPIPDVLVKYFSSSKFDMPERVSGYGIWYLAEEDFIRVAEVFFENPLMATNCDFPAQVIHYGLYHDLDNSVTNTAWEHLITLSKSSSLHYKIYNNYYRYNITASLCHDILMTARCENGELDLRNIDRISEVAGNILQNPQYDVYEKYLNFCYAFYDYSSGTYEDDTISNMAFESLFELAENADEETAIQIRKLADVLDADVSDKLLKILEGNS